MNAGMHLCLILAFIGLLLMGSTAHHVLGEPVGEMFRMMAYFAAGFIAGKLPR